MPGPRGRLGRGIVLGLLTMSRTRARVRSCPADARAEGGHKMDPIQAEELRELRDNPGARSDREPDDPRTGEECPHGLDAGLCMGPSHYPTTAMEAAGVLYPGQIR